MDNHNRGVTMRTRGFASRLEVRIAIGSVVLCTVFFGSSTASAQAWVPPARVGAVNVILQHTDHTAHLMDDGSRLDGYDSESGGALVEVDYAFTDRFSITAGVPYIGARYIGPEPSFFGLEIDDCKCWNTGFQDLSATARYNIFNGRYALTPSVSYGFPTNNYPFVGEAVIGRYLNELRLAVDAGARLDAISTNFSVSGRYSYAFVEQVLDLNLDRSNFYISFDYLFSRRIRAGLQFYWQYTHGGLRSSEILSDEEWMEYDRIIKDNSFHIGGMISYSFSRFDAFFSYIEFVDGEDTHLGRAFTIGFSMPFQL
jgi:hypothetical protein